MISLPFSIPEIAEISCRGPACSQTRNVHLGTIFSYTAPLHQAQLDRRIGREISPLSVQIRGQLPVFRFALVGCNQATLTSAITLFNASSVCCEYVLCQSMLASTMSRKYDLIVLKSIPCFESGGSGVSVGESFKAVHNILSSILLSLDLCERSRAVNLTVISCHY